MLGKNHLIGGVGCAGLLAGAAVAAWPHVPADAVQFAAPFSGFAGAAFAAISGVCYMAGTLAADIDNPKSMAGRYFYLPIGHRTFTHSVWPLAILLALSCLNAYTRPLFYFMLGWLSHLLLDSVSACGVAWLWPFYGYRHYGPNVKIARGWHLKLYHSGDSMEKFIAWLVMFSGAGVFAWSLISRLRA